MKHKAFDFLGNIAIVNFPKDFNKKDKKKFAESILKKNKSIKTVLEKTGRVKGRLRKISTKYIAGEKTKEVLYKENGCVFRFNVDSCYFSPRLSNERKEIASKIKEKNNVLVMFAGVGPYSVVIAKKSGARVFSNEINREANRYARLNAELNNVKNKVVFLDGDIKKIVRKIGSYHSHPYNSETAFGQISSFNKSINAKNSGKAKFVAKDKFRVQRDKLFFKFPSIPGKFDFIVMPRPQLKNSFLEQAFVLSKKGTIIFYYDFCDIAEKNEIIEKIKSEAKKFRKKIKILRTKKAGEIAPYKIRLRVDFKVL